MSKIRKYPRHFGKKLWNPRARKSHNKIGYYPRHFGKKLRTSRERNQLRKKRRRTRRLTSTLVVLSQNLQGFAKDSRSKGRGKREEIIHKMTKHNINICCIQDLNCKQHGHLVGSDTSTPGGYFEGLLGGSVPSVPTSLKPYFIFFPVLPFLK